MYPEVSGRFYQKRLGIDRGGIRRSLKTKRDPCKGEVRVAQ